VAFSDQIKVWWRQADATNWSRPVMIEGGSNRYLYDAKVRVTGETVAIRAFYASVPPWEDEAGWPGTRSSVFVACRDRACGASAAFERVIEPPCRHGSCRLSRPDAGAGVQVPEMSSSGDAVFFGATEKGYVTWSPRRGMHVLRPSGLPTQGTVGAPMLAPDGSLRVVVGDRRTVPRHDGGADDVCRLALFTSPDVAASTDTIKFTRQVATAAPTSTGDCATTLEAFSADHVLIHTDQPAPAYLVRTDRTWGPASHDPTGMLRYPLRPGRHAAGSIVRTGFWHWREILAGSPDGRTLVAQVHFPGTPRWTAPVTVARLPSGLDCFEIAPTPEPAAEPFYVSVRCRTRPVDGVRSYLGVHAVTEDGHTWRSVIGDQLPTRVGEGLYFGGTPAHR
jgi:hypothetical protein